MTYTTNTTTADVLRDQARTIVQNLPTADLIDGARALEDTKADNPEHRMVQAWMMDELENRFPSVIPALDAWADATVAAGAYATTYLEALLAALPEGVAA